MLPRHASCALFPYTTLFRSSLALIGWVASFSSEATSHDWYPLECCNGVDCAPVESTAHTQPITSGSVPELIVTTRHGSAIVPKRSEEHTSELQSQSNLVCRL